MLGEVLQASAHDVPTGVARRRVQPQESRVCGENQGADTHMTPLALAVAEGNQDVVGQDDVKHEARKKEVAVAILENQRGPGLSGVLIVRLAHRASRR